MKTPLSAFDVINGQWWHLQVTGYYLLDLEWKVVYTQKKKLQLYFSISAIQTIDYTLQTVDYTLQTV